MAASSLLVNRPFHASMPHVDYETTTEPFIAHSELAQEWTTLGRQSEVNEKFVQDFEDEILLNSLWATGTNKKVIEEAELLLER